MSAVISEIIIASYLHDVGKFAQRADIAELRDESLVGQICKLQKGGWYSHQHALYTHGFIEKYRDVFPDGLNVMSINKLAAYHHSPSEYEEWVISQGDRLSSGSDRCNIYTQDQPSSDKKPLQFYEKPMLHIISTVHIPERKQNQNAFCRMRPLQEDAILAEKTDTVGSGEYRTLWDAFVQDFKKLRGLSEADFIDALDSLAERYWWCIPSATNTDADISLYQHAKATAAFASALFLYHRELDSETQSALENNAEKKFLFIKGDISGIQSYIFDLKTTKDSAKLLRAKSFQIAALGEIMSGYIVQQFGLSKANILTAAGGNFIVLLPNTKTVRERLSHIQLEIEEYALSEFAGKLSVIVSDGTAASQQDVQKEHVCTLINAIGQDGDAAKQKKMQKALAKNGHVLSELYTELQQFGACPCCGVLPAQPAETGGTARPCKNCQKLIDIGRGLVKSSYLKIDSDALRHFGQSVHVSRSDQGKGWSSINTFYSGHPAAYLPYTAPWKDETKGEPLTFEEIAQKAAGNKKIAMFKADIDNLGLIFSSGLGKRISFSRYADMSHMMHYFFSAYYTWFVHTHRYYSSQTKEDVLYADVIYTVFSGGDDLCILGPWDAVLQFAADFQVELVKFSAGNDSIHISGGISIASPGIPVKNIAQMAESELDKSKEYKKHGQIVKNAITVFDTTVDWETYRKLLADGKKFQQYLTVQEGHAQLSAAVVYKLIDFANQAKAVSKGNLNAHNLLWVSHLHYMISHNIRNAEIRDWLLGFGANTETIIQSRIAVSYGLYTQRTN